MDIFGIGSAIKGCAQIYFRGAIQTGRTTNMLEHLKSGDLVIFLDVYSAYDFKLKAAGKGIIIDVLKCDVHDVDKIWNYGKLKGRVVFDHCWLERYYIYKIESSTRALDKVAHYMGRSMNETVEQKISRSNWLEPKNAGPELNNKQGSR